MKITTHQFGTIEYAPENVISFTSGIFGFEHLKHYLLIKIKEEIFYWLTSIDEPEIVFPLIGVRVIDDKYPEEEKHEAFGIVTLKPDLLKVTVNLKSPVYINESTKTGFQKMLDSDKYLIEYNLFKNE